MTLKRILVGLTVVVVVGLAVFFFVLPGYVEGGMNRVKHPPPYAASPEAEALFKTLDVADLHADSLLWGRDLLERASRAHVDVPRLIEGNVALQVFSVVSKTPRGINIENNSADTDNVTLLAIGQRWPWRAIRSLKERALYQAQRLHDMAQRSDGRLVIVKSRADLEALIERRKTDRSVVGALLALEGAQVLEADPANVDVKFEAGYRMMSPSHFFDTEMGGSAHGLEKGGLTEAGVDMVHRMNEKRMIIDIAHASPATIDDVLELSERPVVVSHTGVKGTCDNNRNLTDDQLRKIAAGGGLIGIGYWETAVCALDAKAIAAAQRYALGVVGSDYIALGSDFDGAIEEPFDTTGLIEITDALLSLGVAPADIAKVMGANQISFLLENLPQ